MSPQQPTKQSPEIIEIVIDLRARAEREKDPATAQSLLASAEKFESADATFHRALAELQESIRNAESVVDESRRRDRLPWWVVTLVLIGLFVFLGLVASR